MATIPTVSNGSYLNSARRQYITMAPFHQDIFAYTTTTNPQTFVVTGTLTSLATVGTATVSNCPANRILRENGKKLYPPGIVVANSTAASAGPYPGVTTYMVGVYDEVTGLSGYIDPNSLVFTIYNSDKPNYVPRGINPNGNTQVDQGPGVYSLGLGQFGQYVNVGSYISTGGAITSGTSVAAGSAVGYGGPGYVGIQTITQTTNKGTAVDATAANKDSPVLDITTANSQLNATTTTSFTLTNSYITADDTLLCVHLSGGTIGTYYVSGTVTGANTATIYIRNLTGGNLTEQPVIRVYVLSS